jgi:hypothetical protein
MFCDRCQEVGHEPLLVALHGRLIRRSVLNAVFDYCAKMKFRSMSCWWTGRCAVAGTDGLVRLKQAGLSGRLYQQVGCLGQAVLKHASHHKDIRLILVDSMKNWGTRVPLKSLSQPVCLFSGVVAS